MFYGVIIYLYFLDTKRLYLPHIHAKYQNDEAVYSISDGAKLEGEIPPSKEKFVDAWIEIHREELMADWDIAVNGNPVFKIEPLK
jgi:hypothetical protein